MAKWVRRAGCVLLVVLLFLMGSVVWIRQKLPDTFMVPQGQKLHLAQMPWLCTKDISGASQAGSSNISGSTNTTLSLWGVIPVKQVRVVPVQRRVVDVCGTPFGIKMFSDGALVVGFTDIRTEQGYTNPAKQAGLKLGDRVLSIGGRATRSNEDVKAAIRKSEGESVTVVYSRDGAQSTITLHPVKDAQTKEYRAGMWVRDSSAGIGTLTFTDNQIGVYGGLGHSISDIDTGQSIALRSGEVVPVNITGYAMGESGHPGELKGNFTSNIALGSILQNGATGVYGKLRTIINGTPMEVAQPQEVETGRAQMLTTIDGQKPQTYEIVIERVSMKEEDPNRNMVVRVVDPALLKSTGGILQGMSGSPIVQNGRLVGAVTHVLVNSPDRGFAIFAQTMLDTADAVIRDAA